jgi:predicted unusual protein kinase regulating ubiquinone biosynthesis (AarF/ABC1/UbiB family)
VSDDIPRGRIRRSGKFASTVGAGGARVAGTMAANLARQDDGAYERLLEQHLRTAQRMVEVLGTMKGAAMKLGQMASFVELEFIPEEFRPLYQEQLAALRDAAPSMGWREIERVLKQEWDEPLSALFQDFDQEAAAAASVGQVHRATTRDGREVAVKVQYPGVAEAVRADLQNVGLIAQLAKAIAPRMDARAIAGEIRERVLEELDYEWEADVQRRFGRRYRGHPFIYVPDVVGELCRRRVLVTEWVDGVPFEEVKARQQDERDRFGEILHRFYYGSVRHVHVFNGDPHPGNYVLLADGRGAFFDFGSTKTLSPERVDLMAAFCLAAADRDATRVKDLLVELGYLVRPDRVAAQRLVETALAQAGWFLADRELQITPELVAEALAAGADPRSGYLDVARNSNLPTDDVLMRRLDLGLVSVLAQLRAKRNWMRIGREWWRWPDEEPSTELGEQEHEFFGRRAKAA